VASAFIPTWSKSVPTVRYVAHQSQSRSSSDVRYPDRIVWRIVWCRVLVSLSNRKGRVVFTDECTRTDADDLVHLCVRVAVGNLYYIGVIGNVVFTLACCYYYVRTYVYRILPMQTDVAYRIYEPSHSWILTKPSKKYRTTVKPVPDTGITNVNRYRFGVKQVRYKGHIPLRYQIWKIVENVLRSMLNLACFSICFRSCAISYLKLVSNKFRIESMLTLLHTH
jgi:hypothetical protein